MIRLNDINKTVIDEKVINGYSKNDDSTGINLIFSSTRTVFVEYNSYETRDKDINLLDKLFDVKSIEDKAYAYPHEIDALKFAMSGIKEECKLVSEGEYDTVKKEEYLTWKDVEQSERLIKAKLPNGDIKLLCYDGGDIVIECDTYYREGYIYDEDLFNALMLKKVE